MVVCLVIPWIQNHSQIFRAPFFLDSMTEVFWIQRHPRPLAILPVRRISAGLTPVNDRCHFRIRSRRQDDVGYNEITMCEHNGHFAANFDSASILKLLDGVRTLEWPSEFWMVRKKDLVQRLLAQATYKIGFQIRCATSEGTHSPI